MRITKLPDRFWDQLEDIFENDFASDVPLPHNAEILVANDKGKRTGFILIEDIKMVGQIYVYPEFRESATAVKTVGNLIKQVRDNAKTGQSIACLASEQRFKSLYKKLGMEKISGEIFRINL